MSRKSGVHDIGWSDEKKWQGCNKEEGTEKHSVFTIVRQWRSQKSDSRKVGKLRAKDQDFKSKIGSDQR